ncbi:hypothetical protein H632_c748p0, partial [Helicosporidium sp. ATCC 50920]
MNVHNPHPPNEGAVLLQLMDHFLDLSEVLSLEDFLCGWFGTKSAEEVLRDNVEEYVVYGLYNKRRRELTRQELSLLADFMEDLQDAWGLRFAPGRNPALRFMDHVHEPLRVYPKPLLVYAGTEAGAALTHLLLAAQGYRGARTPNRLRCWVLPP